MLSSVRVVDIVVWVYRAARQCCRMVVT